MFKSLSSIRLLSICLLLTSLFSVAQKKEVIGTETVNVVKPYTPSISDAFKIKETPSLDDEENSKKEAIKYTIFSFPVASTFDPLKGKAEGVEKAKQEDLFKNYLTFGVGNYRTLNGELYVTEDLNNNDYVAGMFRHHSSFGSIKGTELDSDFYDTSIDLTYGANHRDLSWNADLGYQNKIYNWYGLPTGFGSTLSPTDRASLVDGIDPRQGYNSLYLGGKINFEESIFTNASIKFNHFSDVFESSENRFYVKPSFLVDVMGEAVKTDVIVDYVGGNFKKEYWNTNSIKYGFTNLGIVPSFVMQEDNWTLNLGAGLFYMVGQNSNNEFLVYPKINLSLNVVDDLMIFYTGAEGNLEQNSYMDFADKNPFLSPTLNIRPTDKQYDIFAGLKGKLTNTVSYNIRGSYLNERNKALFKSNDFNENSSNEDYAFGNSLQVVYDDMKTLSFEGDLKADFFDKVSFGIKGTFSSYNNDIQSEAWNLPSVELSSTLDFIITEKWNTGFNVFYVGERKDQKLNTDIIYLVQPGPVTLASYFDVNAHIGYKYNERISAFLKLNNITDKAYQKWLDYPVQSFQFVLGANYKFDF